MSFLFGATLGGAFFHIYGIYIIMDKTFIHGGNKMKRTRKPQNKKPFIIIAITIVIIAVLYTSITIVTSRIRPYVMTHTVLGTKSGDGGVYSPHVYKTGGVYTLADFFLNSGRGVIASVSGNFAVDTETPTIIDETETLPAPSSVGIIERTINPSGGKLSLNEQISINNETKYQLDYASLLDGNKPFETDSSPQVLIVHTHTTESYQPTQETPFSFTSEDRCTDNNYNMVQIGKAVAKELENLGVGTVHITDLFDYPQYDNSYARSCDAVEKVLAEYPSIKIVLDLHRDAITTKSGEKTKITTTINGEKVAQVMVVVGTDELGLKHDNWETNLKYAVNLQKEFLKIDKNFARPINLRTSRFNGHTAPGAVIIEVGAAGNTIDEATHAAKYIAQAVSKSF